MPALPKKIFILLLLCLTTFAHADNAKRPWFSLTDGLAYKHFTVSHGEKNISIHVLRIHNKKFSIKPVQKSKPMHASDIRKESGALAVINANFFDTSNKPLGLVIRDGKILNPFKNISWWAVLCLNNSVSEIIPSGHWNNSLLKRCPQAVQSGPRLLVDGKAPARLKVESSRKSAFGTNKDGYSFFITTEHPMPIQDFAAWLAKDTVSAGLGLLHAINLDGGSSAQLSIKVGDFKKEVLGFASVPVGLAVFAR